MSSVVVKQRPRRTLLPALIILVGVAIILYPVVATQWNNRVQQHVAQEYAELVDDAPQEQLDARIEAARRYNASGAKGPILDPWQSRIAKDNPAYSAYLAELSGLTAMSQLMIPSIDVNLPVYHGTRDDTLQKGLGHLFGTALPVGGLGTHAVITGHTGIPTATLFDDLIDVEVGDSIYLSTFGEKMKYRVYDTEVVLPDEVESLDAQTGRDLITLITCTPYGINSHRLLVHAERVEMDPEEAEVLDQATSTMQWWMWLLAALAVAVIALLILWIMNERRKGGAKHRAN